MTPKDDPRDTDRTLEVVNHSVDGPWGLEVGGAGPSRLVPLRPGAPIVLGSGSRVRVRIHDRAISHEHARLTVVPGGVLVEDLGSKNGLFVSGARISRATLGAAACTFVIGRTTITVRPMRGTDDTAESSEPLEGLVGTSLPMRRLANEIRRVARLRCPVLIHGESGTGKDVVARAIHRESGRAGVFLPLNVAALTDSLADADLFGHRRGAFTGAVTGRPGAFEDANGGTLFLDEIADLSPAVQVKLLRVVEDQAIRPVGGGAPVHVDVRVLSATWASLPDCVAEGRFREDLLHRIGTLIIEVPPLRERLSDMSALATVLLARLEDQVGPKQLTSSAMALLAAYPFPGNVRELSSVLCRAAVLSAGERIEARHVEQALPRIRRTERFEAGRLRAADLLTEYGGNQSAAARAAGVPRSTFRSWLAAGSRSELADED